MKICFWGVRGSIPTPISSMQIQEKIMEILNRVTDKDISSKENKQKFINSLPDYLKSTIGGNTSCVEVICNTNEIFIFDAGSGIRLLGKKLAKNNNPIHIFLTHFHWDHIQGLPFFDPIYMKDREIHFYTFSEDCNLFLKKQMDSPFFPVPIENCSKNLHYHYIKELEPIKIGKVEIIAKSMNHPGGCYAYSLREGSKRFVYSSDVEINYNDFSEELCKDSFYYNADALVFDAQYTLDEAAIKQNWGHTPFCFAVDFASLWKIKKLFLFHHEPNYDDKKLYSMLQSSKWYNDYSVDNNNTQIYLASEGMEFDV